jgi:hypothetical protein
LIGSGLLPMLADLLVSPILLVLSIESHPIIVHYEARRTVILLLKLVTS